MISCDLCYSQGSIPSGSPSTVKFTKVNIGKKVIQEPENKPGVHEAISHDTKSSKLSSLPQHGSCVGGSMLVAPQQMVKPSGLRMPSPSLQFFGPVSNFGGIYMSSIFICNDFL